jgi:hypothetical protein
MGRQLQQFTTLRKQRAYMSNAKFLTIILGSLGMFPILTAGQIPVRVQAIKPPTIPIRSAYDDQFAVSRLWRDR